MHWTNSTLSTITLLATGLLADAAPDRAPLPDRDPRDLVAAAKVDFATAIRTAVGEHAGRVVEVELEAGESADGPQLVWEIDVVTGDGLVEVTVDAIGGGILEVEIEDEAEELEAFRRVLRHAERSIEELAAAAAEVVRGKVVSAEFTIDDGQPIAELRIANGRYLLEVAVEARAGHLVELEMIDDLGEHDADDDDDEEEDDEDEAEADHAGDRDR